MGRWTLSELRPRFTVHNGLYSIGSHSHNRLFHDYFVTHLPSLSLHTDPRTSNGNFHPLPHAACNPPTPRQWRGAAPAPIASLTKDTTVVRIPLRSAKHHFGVSVSRGTRPYNEDTYQAGVIDLPAFAKRSPITLTRVPPSSLSHAGQGNSTKQQLQQYEQEKAENSDGEGKAADGTNGDPQVFYFGVFDGHGGTECSGFLRESLHDYIEDAARKYEIVSSLKVQMRTESPAQSHATTNAGILGGIRVMAESSMEKNDSNEASKTTKETAGEKDEIKIPSTENETHKQPRIGGRSLLQLNNMQRSSDLQSNLMRGWRTLVGGYFRRFSPAAFSAGEGATTTMSALLTYAFLHADLDFISAQARKRDSEFDPVLSDAPLNASDILDSPSYQIGGPKRFQGGSTCSIALISTPSPKPFWHPTSPSTLIMAHVGDTRILLCKTADGNAEPITTDHHPSSSGEENRLRRSAASFVTDSFGEERMSGLANTRAFGDIQSKRLGVSAEPETRRVELSPAEYSFLVLVSDGISGTLDDQEIVDIIKEAKTPDQGAKDVVAFATEVSSEGDNATCLVVRLGGWERRSEGGLGSLGTRERREWRRNEATNPRSRRT